MDSVRAQLDELLGKNRNMTPSEKAKRKPHFSDQDICKNYLCGLCPNELFTNTDIRGFGPCTKLHDEDCLKQYNLCKDKEQYDYEREWAMLIDSIIIDNDKKVKKNKERLIMDAAKLAAEEGLQDNSKELTTQIIEKDDKIKELLKKAEELGEEGQITEAQELMAQAERLKIIKAELEREEESKSHDKKMSVCDICGALLFTGDKEKRSMSHLEGKKHIGYDKIRTHMEEYYKNNKRDLRYRGGGSGGSGGSGSGSGGYYNNNRGGGGGGGYNRDDGGYNSRGGYNRGDGGYSQHRDGGGGGYRHNNDDRRDRYPRDRDGRGSYSSSRGGGDYQDRRREYNPYDTRDRDGHRERERDRDSHDRQRS
ncbi:hypothetical protein SAMD00019534_098690 [Acytostelium subglobosum LB1]|uniref:hypothetical protein n=1 Tax=Acytostelium subglobosum LB1 TaxID=1410327 RepID=UPI000644C8B3|nr:hypothetical protein SAMD00019534_098690 [Acytostelium subglobosum LB1]GAM26694.1 hypothetical protein SAMD00019534_098690 [Acytostelium subglobosum LB1]|eukprot:XP_012750355.1 hypothetical protein SAMD00019534_098690 [Acytostelium subglobosum LB1]